MSEQGHKYLFLLLGTPGSGKSYLSDWLEPEYGAVRLSSDAIREAMYAPVRPKHHRQPYSSIIFKAMEHSAEQALSEGRSVIYDTNNNKVSQREELSRLARRFAATPVLIWVKTPLETAVIRATDRDTAENGGATPDMSYVREMADRIETPISDEFVIIIDGTLPADQQKQSLDKQLKTLVNDNSEVL